MTDCRKSPDGDHCNHTLPATGLITCCYCGKVEIERKHDAKSPAGKYYYSGLVSPPPSKRMKE